MLSLNFKWCLFSNSVCNRFLIEVYLFDIEMQPQTKLVAESKIFMLHRVGNRLKIKYLYLSIFEFLFRPTVPGVIGCLQALEAIKVAAAVGEPLSGRMLLFDALSARIRVVCSILFLLYLLF